MAQELDDTVALQEHPDGEEMLSHPMEVQRRESVSPTQPYDEADTSFATEEDGNGMDEGTWGLLEPCSCVFDRFILSEDKYTFGRDTDCDYNLNIPADGNVREKEPQKSERRRHESLKASYSKLQFHIIRESLKNGGFVVFIHDDSQNGTYLDSIKIGQGKKKELHPGNVISLVSPRNRAFMFRVRSPETPFPLPTSFTEKYEMSRELGRGACGTVRLCFPAAYDGRFAVKIIEKKTISTVSSQDDGCMDREAWNRREVEIMQKIDHPNIVKVFDLFENDLRVFIVMEYVEGGDMFPWITKLGKIPGENRSKHVKRLAAQMVLAVKYLHGKGITHRDLKPENILVSGELPDLVVKVTDFGLSKVLSEETLLKTFCGTPTYIAPEILLRGCYTEAVDCWSLGVVIFVLLASYPPFSKDYADMPLHDQIKTARIHWYPSNWRGIDLPAKDLVTQLLSKDPPARLSIDKAWGHEWFRDPKLDEHLIKLLPELVIPPRDESPLNGNLNGKRNRDRAFSASPS